VTGAVELVDPADADAVRAFVTGWLFGALLSPDNPLEVTLEPHVIDGRFLPSFDVHVGRHALVVHVDTAIAR
jgi:hypothetical protein